jgi:hypothetical protein
MKIPIFFLTCTLVTLATGMLPTVVMADFFKYKDDGGNLIITNRFEDVPKKYRNRVKVVWDKDLTAKDPVARRSAAALEHYKQQEVAKKAQQQADNKKDQSKKGKTLVIELDEKSGQLIRRFE